MEFTYPLISAGRQIAEIECKAAVNPDGTYDIEVYSRDDGGDSLGYQPLLNPPVTGETEQALEKQIREWLENNEYGKLVEATEAACAGAQTYAREAAV